MVALPFSDMSYGTDMSTDYKNRRVNFGDGFSQRAKRLNGSVQQWKLVWDNIPDATAETLRAFFEGLQATDIIDWQPYNQPAVLKWTADRFSSKPTGYQTQSCSVTLTQEFDL